MEQSVRILIADDEDIVHETLGGYLRDSGQHVDDVLDGLSALKALQSADYDLALIDVRMPGMDGLSLLGKVQEAGLETSCVIITGHGQLDTAVQAIRLGAVDFLVKPVKLLELDAVVEKAVRVRRLRQDKRHLRETIGGMQAAEDRRLGNRRLVGDSAATRKVREEVRQAAEAGCDTILVTGETGTGKEIVAREIHFAAGDEDSPFIAVSCPALTDSLVESELFGHTKGSFTGATADKAGCFELADGGTLFLDEVADLSASAQAVLLRALETRSFRRVGGAREISVKLRVVAATNAPLETSVEKGTFRRDLFYRLNVYRIHLLPLRERPEDILPLAEHMLAVFAAARGAKFEGFAAGAQELLLGYSYPGNGRELRNLIERAAILCRSGQILPEHLNLPEGPRPAPPAPPAASELDDERARILKALEHARWNRRQAAQDLGMPYSTLRYKILKLDIR